MSDTTVGILSVYYGKLPDYFPVWLESCKNNKTVDFILVTDQMLSVDVPNVKVIQSTLEQFRAKAAEVLGFEVVADSPYKLCDFKAAYGIIFQDVLAEYDYWGHCDIDLIWGDLRGFFKRYQLEKYDKFLPLGHLSLYRNTMENNRRFMETVEGLSDYKKIFQSRQNYLLDELALIHIYKDRYPFFDQIIFADIWPWKRRYTMCTQLTYYPSIYKEFAEKYDPINFKEQVFLWIDGKIYQYYTADDGSSGRREYIYIHIQKRKWKLDGVLTNRMYISQNKVGSMSDDLENIPLIIQKYNPYSWYQDVMDDTSEFLAHCWSYFKRRIIKTEVPKVVVEKPRKV